MDVGTVRDWLATFAFYSDTQKFTSQFHEYEGLLESVITIADMWLKSDPCVGQTLTSCG